MRILHVSFFYLFILAFFACQGSSTAQGIVKDIKTQWNKEPGIIVDVRTPDEWNNGHHPKAIHADWMSDDFRKKSATWDKNKTYYLHCEAGGRSGQAVEYLRKNGFKKVYNAGGYDQIKDLK
ncbi:MAG: rhodanese-like domain-containing protein [Saprospiraceae bacterium]|nr:rhodanese-like domain-containing protein [Saprospiraceae bacterium]